MVDETTPALDSSKPAIARSADVLGAEDLPTLIDTDRPTPTNIAVSMARWINTRGEKSP